MYCGKAILCVNPLICLIGPLCLNYNRYCIHLNTSENLNELPAR